jgi:hypothetical protein
LTRTDYELRGVPIVHRYRRPLSSTGFSAAGLRREEDAVEADGAPGEELERGGPPPRQTRPPRLRSGGSPAARSILTLGASTGDSAPNHIEQFLERTSAVFLLSSEHEHHTGTD